MVETKILYEEWLVGQFKDLIRSGYGVAANSVAPSYREEVKTANDCEGKIRELLKKAREGWVGELND